MTTDAGQSHALFGVIEITPTEYTAFRDYIYERCGISLGDQKQILLQNRLNRRLRSLGLSSFMQYLKLLEDGDPGGSELDLFLNAVTTNKTDFFREQHHFDFLRERWLPAKQAAAAQSGDRRLRVWSAGCSSGEEPYSIAITLLDALGADAARWPIAIHATDLNSDVLRRAANAIYADERVTDVPQSILKRHFLRGTGDKQGLVRVKQATRSLVTFQRLNFMDGAWGVPAPFDVIFCRNAMIYFDQPTQQTLVGRFLEHLAPGGHLIIGHSESIHGRADELVHEGKTIYRRVTAPLPSRAGVRNPPGSEA
ncbi:MAG: protein-glutamate O-methyltransferase [Planctomycetes bacterium]|nr:protein-glutamate O-methyltransferase [Planctomycetota bacterium]